MAYHTQLGRFGDVAQTLTGMSDFDHRAANLIALNGKLIGKRPRLVQLLATKGFSNPKSNTWKKWVNGGFTTNRNQHMAAGGFALQPNCAQSPAGFPVNYCTHELAPPLHYGSLSWFNHNITFRADTIQTNPDGSESVDPSVKPTWNFIITVEGEIITGSEDFEAIKHTCLAAGGNVWSAGQIGIKNKMVKLVDLQSGHYVRANVAQGTPIANALIAFTEAMFKDYCAYFNIGCLDPAFTCIWG
jgi:hypothetical protein